MIPAMLKAFDPGVGSSAADVMIVVLPHLGILDSWLPILDELKRRQYPLSLSAVVPERIAHRKTLVLERLVRAQHEDFLMERCNALVDFVFTRAVGETWSRFETFHDAAEYAITRDRRSPGRRDRYVELLYKLFPHAMAVLDRGTPKASVVLSDVYLLDRSAMRPLRH